MFALFVENLLNHLVHNPTMAIEIAHAEMYAFAALVSRYAGHRSLVIVYATMAGLQISSVCLG